MFNAKIAKKKYIIKSGDDAVSFFTIRNLILKRAKKQEGINTYLLGANQDAINNPSIDELIAARESVYVPERALKDLLRLKGKEIPRSIAEWEAIVDLTLPDNYYCPYKGTPEPRNESLITPWINPMLYYQLIKVESETVA